MRLRVHNLSKRFGSNRVFSRISLAHTVGVLGIAGSNGSGKSTLLQCLSGLMRPTSGQVQWYKKEQPVDTKNIKKVLGYAAPYINLYEELSCRENLEFVLQLRHQHHTSGAVKTTLQRAEITDLADRLYGNLSTGQQQRMRLAAAIVHQPDILFLDEPGSNLDEQGRALIVSLVAEFKEEDKMVVVASNNPEELDLCDGVYSVEKEQFL